MAYLHTASETQDFIDKIYREGGIDYAAFEYGLKSGDYDIPMDLADAWDDYVHFTEDWRNSVLDAINRYAK